MFEYFLDQGIKQSEGQFFTPMPICKFILMSLPLESLIQNSTAAPKAIDYACGAGHFLNELAAQIKPFIHQYKQTDAKLFFSEIIGIEKEYRLSKVAKVAAFMYGQESIDILHHDALDEHPKVQKDSFNILVANPPFAVEGFLETLPEEQREQYTLTQTVNDVANNKNIQCFFLERAKQLLAPGGVAGIIVPSSVLSNSDSTHIGSREILLQYFDIIALVELGNGTFGKTGTNTVVLFLRRKRQKPDPAEHYRNRVEDWFEGGNEDEPNEDMETYQDWHLIKKYCTHIGVSFNDYQSLLNSVPSSELLACELFLDYKKDFDQSPDIRKLHTQRFFKNFTPEQKQAELDKRFLAYLHKIEQDKLYHFVLATSNPQPVLVVKSPSDNKEQKQFLGYEWSAAKGNEGIKLITDSQGQHRTPLYDPQNRYNPDKINALIQANFLGQALNLSGLEHLVSATRLVDLLDFSRKDFDKHLSLSVKKKIDIESKWELVKLGDVCNILIGGTPSRKVHSYFTGNNNWVSISEMNGQVITSTKEKITNEGVQKSNVKLIPKGTTLLSFKLSIGKTAIAGVDLYTNEAIAGLIPKDKIQLMDAFLFHIFTARFIDLESTGNKVFGNSLNSSILKDDVKIPLPPLKIQTQIVQVCEAVDAEVEKAISEIEIAKKEIENETQSVINKEYPTKKLTDICTMQAGKFVSASEISDMQDKDLFPCYGGNGLRGYTKTFTHDGHFPLIGRQGALCGNIKIVQGKFHATEHAIVVKPNADINVYWLYHQLKLLKLNQYATGVAQPGLSVQKILSVLTIVPPLKEQENLVQQIETQETKITAAQALIDSAASKKQAILKQYL
ncbi:MAG: restriction endonuclease subunit S [Methylobacter sp.]|nr:restriction endonuclease subunit S [Methylobacter sp.]MDZ4220730.1 restriction endonuclease subunit S [Methylobacter sp.]